jgi:hypothetical protein
MQTVGRSLLSSLLINLIDSFDTRSEHEKQEEIKMLDAIRNGPKSMRVVGRGTVVVDPEEIANSPSFKRDLERARLLVEHCNKIRNNKG